MFVNFEKKFINILFICNLFCLILVFFRILAFKHHNETIRKRIEKVKLLTSKNKLSKTSEFVKCNYLENNNKLNINLAKESDLIRIPGIGKVLAKRIIEYREKNKCINDITELLNISGISANKIVILSNYLTTFGGISSLEKAYNQKINLNFATVEDLEKIPGISKLIARKIINYRNQKGVLSSFEDLYDIQGLSEAKIKLLMKYIEIK